MSHEFSPQPEQFQDRPSVKEILNVKNLPEMAFQSYEMLKNNAVELKNDFFDGKFRNPKLEYSKFGSPDGLSVQLQHLEDATASCNQFSEELGPDGIGAIETTLGFRANEMRLIELFATLNEAVERGISQAQVEDIVIETRNLNERLYGKANPEILKSSLGQVWQNIDGKTLSESAKNIYLELENGFTWGDTQISGLPKPEGHNQLPDFNHPSLAWAGEIILNETASIGVAIHEIWDQKVEEFGDDYAAGPEDIVEMFEAALQLMDPTGEAGVGVELDPGASALSWDSSTMSIKVGDKRKAIESAEMVYKKFLHEGFIHGGRAISGIKTELPVLGTGLFTNTERADYLTFEEGLATTVEEAVSGVEPKWDSTKLGHYINIWLASQGNDFRSVFETAWRYRLLDQLKDNQEVDDALIAKHKSAAYTACVRIFRGTPTNLSEQYPGISPITYSKDLAYLNGRVIAMDYLADLHETQDEAGLMRLMSAKFDPTVPEQNRLVDEFFGNDRD